MYTEPTLAPSRVLTMVGQDGGVPDNSFRLQCIASDLCKEVTEAMEDGYSLHDDDLQVMAMNINRGKKNSWVTRFKQKNRIGSRRTTKFVSKRNFIDDARIKKEAADFVEGIKQEMKTRPLNQIYNADQSGFLKELHSKRSLTPIGQKTVVRIVQSPASLTHSYTVMPLVFADGTMGDYLFVVLQEPKGQIIQCIFTPSTSSSDLLILLDSWMSFRDKAAINSSLPPGKILHTRQIPAGATGICQPLDTYAFKNYSDFVAFQRDNIPKLISLSFRILRSDQFKPMIQYAWHAAGYLDSPPNSRFKTPVEYCFPRSIYSKPCHSTGCKSMSFIQCPLCDNSDCFKCYVVDYHTC
ncbi:hypothetical protein PRIPAC_90568 [Pristionchus pacificus]|uniref:Transp_Tc5_C domain-containing protein n=1 Tax=Pristionchus pacificus TaxID=54126 RepID=A0A2A6CY27_PRIPA|nr:hypothetical protein PRIPAC_90568 [Pristionchus pacificus]|eukprot:PDM82931.1 hypothetical protein PRIPAC_37324 [Pristionchus pacificus]